MSATHTHRRPVELWRALALASLLTFATTAALAVLVVTL